MSCNVVKGAGYDGSLLIYRKKGSAKKDFSPLCYFFDHGHCIILWHTKYQMIWVAQGQYR